MQRYLVGTCLCLGLSTLLCGDELMSARIESVVDEVSELRTRYEDAVQKNRACMQQVGEQQEQMQKIAKNEGYNYELFEKNRERLNRLEAENAELKKASSSSAEYQKEAQSLQKEIDRINKENARLESSAEILVEKNQALLKQLNTIKRSDEAKSAVKEAHKSDADLLALERELAAAQETNKKMQESSRLVEENLSEKFSQSQQKVKSLEGELETSKRALDELHSKHKALEIELEQNRLASALERECEPKRVITVCKDDNPFPKLMMKEDKEVRAHEVEAQMTIEVNKSPLKRAERIVTEKGGVYRVNKEAAIYDAPDGKVIEHWEEMRSFTSNVSEGEWIKITGYFVDRKWQRSAKEMWVKAKDTLKR